MCKKGVGQKRRLADMERQRGSPARYSVVNKSSEEREGKVIGRYIERGR